jgi:hypothetical protein
MAWAIRRMSEASKAESRRRDEMRVLVVGTHANKRGDY